MRRRSLFLLPILLTLLAGCARDTHRTSLVTPNVDTPPSGITWCGTLELPGRWQDDTPTGGLSDLAWDADEGLLYMISDRGWLHRARPIFNGKELTGLEPLKTYVLRNAEGHALTEAAADAESLIVQRGDNGVRGDSVLLIGFERDHRLQRFYPNGTPASQPLYFHGLRGAENNRGAEALGRHPNQGAIVGLESAPSGMPEKATRLFAVNTGQEWTYPLADATGSALTALETYDGGLLALERAFAPPAPLIISLRSVRLNGDGTAAAHTLVQLSTGEGWRLDNFEGLTRLGDNRYLMVSDDNFSLVQETLLSCFELPPFLENKNNPH
ncbi:esterase-like activity of phytase family protein [Halomonas sp. McH1-25]|uniref:esterase-like activity of phytase family protein n=1 Tax=unclassified Halomonas TaxID=2609666 RepID=UPI001EF6DB79|nr:MULTISPECIES: esterase-like activity of phytase family protein [unclassified Halomonas]MCG7599452.1 esterase-like activity of phytase family protein [Halomonas sp. McH1-25]MCP1342839.1 esterase-like activity of phytase family protein [Halomonas sp. FL8]MCP1361976.1 esterase-like activity of phytase family protein [Halomonas sp. BBD45]MCP1366472.1 esterase-like activity of phytase family protein [Halomonas sp. BBD48]